MIVTSKEDCPQGSEAWFAIRAGRATGSQFKRIITPGGKLSAQAGDYITELIANSFCPQWQKWMGNRFTEWGTETEPEARDVFAKHIGANLEEVGFVTQDNGVCGCSPDAFILDSQGNRVSGVEIKCPAPHTHVSWFLEGGLPDEHKPQTHGFMAVTGLDTVHFWSYFPGLKPLHVVVVRDDYTRRLEEALEQFVLRYAAKREELIPKLILPKTEPA